MAKLEQVIHGRTALMLYGSETGNAQDIAEEIGRLCERLRFQTHVAELNAINLRQLLCHDVVIFSIATTGQGDLPANAQNFWRILRSIRLLPGCLKSLRFVSFGLGDSSYPKFNWAHRKLYNRLIQLGAQPVYERGESDEQHPEGIDGSFLPWSLGLRQRLLDVFPLPKGQDTIPDDVPLEPRWSLCLHTDIDRTSLVQKAIDNVIISQVAASGNVSSENSLGDTTPPDDLLDVPNALIASVESNTRLTPTSHWQDVRLLTLRLQHSHSYNPGDVLTIYPKNFPSDVNHFLTLMNWTSIADKPIHFIHNPQRTPETNLANQASPPIQFSDPDHVFTLRELLTNNLDIMSIPRRSFFSQLLHYTDNPFHRERLQEFTNPEFTDELYDYTSRPRRSILEVLDEFTSVKIPWQKVCSVVPKIRGRQFSIASGGVRKFGLHSLSPLTGDSMASEATKVELLVAIVKYRTVIKRIRLGVATRYIASLRPGQRISVTLEKGGLGFKKEDVSRPVVMIGPGTGVAPMRNLIYERMAVRKQMGMPPPTLEERDILFYGCRNREADFFFRDEWDEIKEEAGLSVFVAFSRDQKHKVYVQDLIREQSKAVYHAIVVKQGIVYICGSSGKMPQAVRQALIDVFQQEGSMAREEAEANLVKMEKDSRYKQETW